MAGFGGSGSGSLGGVRPVEVGLVAAWHCSRGTKRGYDLGMARQARTGMARRNTSGCGLAGLSSIEIISPIFTFGEFSWIKHRSTTFIHSLTCSR